MDKQPLTATTAALSQLGILLQSRHTPSKGIRVSVRQRGCTGRSYELSFVDRTDPLDHVCPLTKDITLFIDPKALMFLIGTTIDYCKSDLEESFIFRNPNEKGRCGCGESFYT